MPEGNGILLAAVTLNDEDVWGGMPCFHARDEQEQRLMAHTLAHIMNAMVHELPGGVLVLVRH